MDGQTRQTARAASELFANAPGLTNLILQDV